MNGNYSKIYYNISMQTNKKTNVSKNSDSKFLTGIDKINNIFKYLTKHYLFCTILLMEKNFKITLDKTAK